MSLSGPFIRRPVGTTLLTVAITLAGAISYFMLPVSPLPQVEFPTINVNAGLPGASPETMASAVATPLERQFGRIAGITEMSSSSGLGSTQITMQFDLNRDIDSAARDVQAAINAARGQLPANLPSNPTYRKANPADAPVLMLAMTSDTYAKPRVYDVASTILQQKLSQISGVGQVVVGGGAPPAVRVEINPNALNAMGLTLEDVRTALAAANANRPKGLIDDGERTWSISTTDQLLEAAQYRPMIIAYRNGAPVRLSDVATVLDSVTDVRTSGSFNGKTAVQLIIYRQPGANIIDTVDRVKALLPQFRAEIPAGIQLDVSMDRTTTIRASVEEVEHTLLLSIGLVILVVFVFLRDVRATLIPSVAVPVSLIATFGVMYLFGFSIDNLSMMALTIATGFVVDDAIVVVENISRHLERGMRPAQAALLGAKEIGFTVLTISVSLVAVFIPLLLMGGIVGRLFREFAIVLSVSIGVSMVVSLTTTPMMCAQLLKPHSERRHGWLYRFSESIFDGILAVYRRTLSLALRFHPVTMAVLLVTIGLTVMLYTIVPKGFFPQQDTGRLMGNLKTDQSMSFQATERLFKQFATIIRADPAIENVMAWAGGGSGSNSARMFISLKPLDERDATVDEVMKRLRKRMEHVPGGVMYLTALQDVRVGGRSSSAQYQYTLLADDLNELNTWGPKLLVAMRKVEGLVDVDIDQQNRGLQTMLAIDRETANRLQISQKNIDDTLYDAFGQRQASLMYKQLNQYHVVMEVEPRFWQDPDSLRHIYVEASKPTAPSSASSAPIRTTLPGEDKDESKPTPLSAFASYKTTTTPLSVNHSGLFPSTTISFNLVPGTSLGEAMERIEAAGLQLGLPATVRGSFQGTAQAFQSSLANMELLILAALVTVYIVLGVLYESYIHPITILSTLPSAGVGALLALLFTGTELSVMAMIGIILLIGIVKKNAIMMIDFALEAERRDGMTPEAAIFEACILRFRPITMTTMAALLGGLPLALGTGVGSELRRPLGIAIVGGLIFSQMLTLYTTPVVYLYLDRLRLWVNRRRGFTDHVIGVEPVEAEYREPARLSST